MTGNFASEASGPQKLQKYILRDLYASSLGKKTFLKVRIEQIHSICPNGSRTGSGTVRAVAPTTAPSLNSELEAGLFHCSSAGLVERESR